MKKNKYLLGSFSLMAGLLIGSQLNFLPINNFKKLTIVSAASTAQNLTHQTILKNIFTPSGSAYFTADNTSMVLTNDLPNQTGKFYLNQQIDMSQDFSLTGMIDLGNKSQKQGGADGISFIFQAGDPAENGAAGNAMGIGGLSDAFGFKLDTYHNDESNATAYYANDPATMTGHAFGSFFYTDQNKITQTLANSAQIISDPTANQFRPITITYRGSTKIMTINYEGKTWQQNLSAWIDKNQALSFAITGSTGVFSNLQRFRLLDFNYQEYVPTSSTATNFLDENGNQIQPSTIFTAQIGKNYQTVAPKTITVDGQNYYLDEKRLPQNSQGKITDQTTEVNYYYYLKSTVTVRFLNEKQQKISADQVITDQIGKKYFVTLPKQIKYSGLTYTLKAGIPAVQTGSLLPKPISLTFYYERKTDPLTVKYLDQSSQQTVKINHISDQSNRKIQSPIQSQLNYFKTNRSVVPRNIWSSSYAFKNKKHQKLNIFLTPTLTVPADKVPPNKTIQQNNSSKKTTDFTAKKQLKVNQHNWFKTKDNQIVNELRNKYFNNPQQPVAFEQKDLPNSGGSFGASTSELGKMLGILATSVNFSSVKID
jgi:hypothetical protein